jgi:hypothetical protein
MMLPRGDERVPANMLEYFFPDAATVFVGA